MATVIATIDLKGGVGKSTTTAAVAEFMSAEFGLRVLVMDLDPQTNLTTMSIGEERWQEVNDQGATAVRPPSIIRSDDTRACTTATDR